MVADWMFALVRTGDAGSRQRGLTYLLDRPVEPRASPSVPCAT